MGRSVTTSHGHVAALVSVDSMGDVGDMAEPDPDKEATLIAVLKGQSKMLAIMQKNEEEMLRLLREMVDGQKDILERLERVDRRLVKGVKIKLF